MTLAPNLTIETSNNGYKVPNKVLGTAVKCVSGPIYVSWQSKFTISKFYVYFHFAEIEKLEGGKQRTLNIRFNDFYNLETLTLDYLKTQTVASFALTGETKYNFSISGVDSGLPPILNAYEIYQHKDFYRLPTIEKEGKFNSLVFFFTVLVTYCFLFLFVIYMAKKCQILIIFQPYPT